MRIPSLILFDDIGAHNNVVIEPRYSETTATIDSRDDYSVNTRLGTQILFTYISGGLISVIGTHRSSLDRWQYLFLLRDSAYVSLDWSVLPPQMEVAI